MRSHKAQLYNMEKVLYFASRDEGLHVDSDEKLGTDLSELVARAIKRKWIAEAARDDSGVYYRITTQGEIHLLQLQIQWRTQKGKDTERHCQRLEELKAAWPT